MAKIVEGLKSAVKSPHLWVDVMLILTLIQGMIHEPWKGLVASVLAVISFYFHAQP